MTINVQKSNVRLGLSSYSESAREGREGDHPLQQAASISDGTISSSLTGDEITRLFGSPPPLGEGGVKEQGSRRVLSVE